MSNYGQPQPGFVMPPPHGGQQQAQPGYNPNYPPPQPAGYPPQPQYNNYHPQQPPYPSGHQPFPPPVQHQPGNYGPQGGSHGAGNWFQGGNLENYLRNATSFHVKQKVELVEAVLGWETGNKYTVKDQAGNKVLYVGEESGICSRQFCNARRPITLAVKDTVGSSIMIMDRPLDCSCCFGLFCADSMNVSTPTGQLLGSVVEEFSILYPTFSLKDAQGRTALRIEGPMCPLSFGSCGGQVVFKVLNNNGVAVGTISKHWGGLARELFTDADYFSMSFPLDLDPAVKAVCLAALFLIDYEYFEEGSGSKRLFG